jgi:hypothetical protein
VYDFFINRPPYLDYLQENGKKMEKQTISLDDKQVIIKQYKIRAVGRGSATIETAIPKEAFGREARNNGMTTEEALVNLIAVWRFDGFEGLYLSFEKAEG